MALAALAIAAAVFDLRSRRIPNWLTGSGFALAVILNAWLLRLAGLERAGLGALLAAAVYVPLYALRATGAGDVKLMVAIGAFAGARNWFVIFLMAAITGGVLAIILLLTRGGLRRVAGNVLLILGTLVRGRAPYKSDPRLDVRHPGATTLPHAVPIAAGTLIFLALERFA